MKKAVIIVLILISSWLSAQDKPDESKYGIKFGGFVKTDAFHDTRQTVSVREGHFLLYPDNRLKDANGKDINDAPNFNILSIQTRLRGVISGPDAFGAKTSGLIEADFFGNENSSFIDANGFRLRHGLVKLNWKKTELMAGQFWHPLFVPESYPEVISFNTGAPFQPFTRNPQVRLTVKAGPMKFIAAALSQRDFQTIGADGASTKYLRNSQLPNGHVQIQFQPDSTEHLFGVAADFKQIMPEVYSTGLINKNKYRARTTLDSYTGMGFLKLKFKPFTFKVQVIYAQNGTDLTMIGGFAVRQYTDSITGAKSYTNLNTGSIWAELTGNGKKIRPAVFFGYSENMGSDVNFIIAYGRATNMDHVYRVAPRIVFISSKFNLALEEEYTYAHFGTLDGSKKGKVINCKGVENFRTMLSFIYNF